MKTARGPERTETNITMDHWRRRELSAADVTRDVPSLEGLLKPLVVLIPDAIDWVLGSWAREIAEHNQAHYDFVIFPVGEIGCRPEQFGEILGVADVVHCLTQSAFALVERSIRKAEADHLTVIAAIHHIQQFEDVRPCLAADRIAVMCSEVFEALVEGGVPEEKLFLLRKGIDTDFFRRRDRAETRKRLGLPEGEFVVGFAAKAKSDDRGRKGVDVFLNALSQLPAEPRSPIRLALTGPGWEPTLAAGLPSQIAAHYFPFLAAEAMPDFYSAIDVYVSTARVEGGPLPPFEAMSCATPIVSTPVGMIREFVTDGVEGLLVPVDDASRTAKAIERLRNEPELAAAMGRAGREAVARHLGCREAALRAHALYGAGSIQPRRAGRDGPTEKDLEHLNEELIASDVGRWNDRLTQTAQFTRTKRPAADGFLRSLLLWLGYERIQKSEPTREIAHVDLEELRISDDSWVLDLGCGTGQFSIPLLERGCRAVSVDLDVPRLGEVRDACAEKNLTARILLGDGANLPFHSESFDAVVCREMIEHTGEPGAVVEEIKRVLKPQGRLCVTVPSAHTERYFQWVDSRWLAMAGHVNVFTRATMCELLEAHGFHVLEIRGRNFFYSLFWFIHTLTKTTHDGTGRIKDHFGLSRRIFRAWRMLGNGRTKRGIEGVGNLIFPKSYVYYCERAG